MILRQATFNDSELLLEWRNDIQTRNNSHNTELVKPEIHKKWLASVLENEKVFLFIAILEGQKVGTVRADFDNDKSQYELSWTVAPSFRGKGIGKLMVKCLVDKLTYNKSAEIKKENIASVKIAEYAGMKFQKEENSILYYITND